ncbi:MAG: tyrosine-type recombinase/integrase [Mailhella sp.]|nr:tyrosine-type recombinase/integrase [Mailhella sp.]
MGKRVQGENLQSATSVRNALRLGLPAADSVTGERVFPCRLNDGGSLSLDIRSPGRGSWVYRASVAGKKVAVTLGNESLPLVEARRLRNEARILARQGINPNEYRKAAIAERQAQDQREGLTYEKFARRWIESPAKVRRTTEETRQDDWNRLACHALPRIGRKNFYEITRADYVGIIESLVGAGKVASAKKLLTVLNQIEGYAVDVGELEHTRTERLSRLVPARLPNEIRHRAATTDPAGVGEIMRRIHSLSDFRRGPAMCIALRIIPYMAIRSKELRGATWDEIDWENQVWRIPYDRMKGRIAFNVPISRQVFALLKELQEITGDKPFIFHSPKSKDGYITSEGLRKALEVGCGISKDDQCIHGFRAVWKTLAKDEGLPEVIQEAGVAHKLGNTVAQAYDRSDLFPVRRQVAQWWADYLDALRDGRPTPKAPIQAWSVSDYLNGAKARTGNS